MSFPFIIHNHPVIQHCVTQATDEMSLNKPGDRQTALLTIVNFSEFFYEEAGQDRDPIVIQMNFCQHLQSLLYIKT